MVTTTPLAMFLMAAGPIDIKHQTGQTLLSRNVVELRRLSTGARWLRVAICALFVFGLTAEPCAQTNSWAAVQRLLRGSELAVQRHTGDVVYGRLDSVDDAKLVIITRRPFSLMRRPLGEHSIAIRRAAIREVDRVVSQRRGFMRNRKDDRAVVYVNQQRP